MSHTTSYDLSAVSLREVNAALAQYPPPAR